MNKHDRMTQLIEDLAEAGEALEVRNAQLEQAHAADRELLRYTSAKLDRQQHILDRAIDIAGRMSVLFPVSGEPLMALSERNGRKAYEVTITTHMDYWTMPIHESFTAKVDRLELMISRINPDHLSRAVHARVDFAGQELCYGITRTAMLSIPPARLTDTVLNELGHAMAKKLLEALR